MEFSIKNDNPTKQHSACIVVGVFETRILSYAAKILDKNSNGYISSILKNGDMDGKLESTLLLYNVPNSKGNRVLLVGLGKKNEICDREYRSIIRSTFNKLHDTGASNASLYLIELSVKNRTLSWKISQTVIDAMEGIYRSDKLKSKRSNSKQKLQKITLSTTKKINTVSSNEALQYGLATADGMNIAKDLGNLPANICTPTYLAKLASKMAKKYKLKVTILTQENMEKLGMGSLLSVAQGSNEPAKLITLEYWGQNKKERPLVLVGKGVTFDTGGISLKPAASMDEMKYDMCGAASVFGTITAIAKLKLPINVVGIIPTTENMPGGKATKPGDIVTSMSGQTIEILNTDAEGRLILCDALTYAERYNPELVIDIATLTGACVVALGRVATGLLSNDNKLASELLSASEEAADRAWHLPLWSDYDEQLRSNFADMANIGGRDAGTITASCFLARFTKKYRWAHLDIAGTAWHSGSKKGATGRPVPLLTKFLMKRATKKISRKKA
ncbi:MAG: leucyl aminopeptidase [Nitrosomonadaceae bacterium]|nr:leucyl aminopeptidase [Nitrosomonadaceae bacterium]